MNCPRCKGELPGRVPQCPHCGAKFVAKPKPAPAAPAGPSNDDLLGPEPARPEPASAPAPTAPMPGKRPPPSRGIRRGGVIHTGRPSTVGTGAMAGGIKAIGSVLGVILIIGLIGLRIYLRSQRGSRNPDANTVTEQIKLELGGAKSGSVVADFSGSYPFQVRTIKGQVRAGIGPIAGKEPTPQEAEQLVAAASRNGTDSAGSLRNGVTYVWMVLNDSEDEPAEAIVFIRGK